MAHHLNVFAKKALKGIGILFFYFVIQSSALSQSFSDSPTQIWLKESANFSIEKILKNFPADGLRGAIVAAQSRYHPNYYYHWVRDAGLTVDSMIKLYQTTNHLQQQNLMSKKIFDYLYFSTKIQKEKTFADLGEPKFNIDGTAYTSQWARPQNDGPAIRAISLIHWANILLSQGKESVVREKMYQPSMPAASPIKMDLEYISHHWRDPSFDIWEEVKGMHFYTLMVERKALLEGALLAKKLGDHGAANWYVKQAKEIEIQLQRFWDPAKAYLVATLDRKSGIDYKSSNLDTAVILGLLYGDMMDGFFSWNDPRVLATIDKIIDEFTKLYPINHRPEIPGIAIGRYIEDRYAGTQFNGGNPWPLCTLAIAEALYRYAQILKQHGQTEKAKEISNRADQFVERIRYHAKEDGSLDEQINRHTGFMSSATDLTWNYASLLNIRETLLNYNLHRH